MSREREREREHQSKKGGGKGAGQLTQAAQGPRTGSPGPSTPTGGGCQDTLHRDRPAGCPWAGPCCSRGHCGEGGRGGRERREGGGERGREEKGRREGKEQREHTIIST